MLELVFLHWIQIIYEVRTFGKEPFWCQLFALLAFMHGRFEYNICVSGYVPTLNFFFLQLLIIFEIGTFQKQPFWPTSLLHGNHVVLKMKSVKLDMFHSYIETEGLIIELVFSMVLSHMYDWNFLEVVFLTPKVYSVNLHRQELIKKLEEGIFSFSKFRC